MRSLKLALAILALTTAAACSGGNSDGNGGRTAANNGGQSAASGGSQGGSTGFGGDGPTAAKDGTGGSTSTTGGAMPVSDPGPLILDPQSSPFKRDDTANAGLPADQLDRLKAGGSSCSAEIIYPYQNAMFPGALPSPPIMWNSGADAVYLHATYHMLDTVDYEFAAGASNPGEVRIPQDAWNEITRRTQNSPLVVEVSVDSGGNVSTCNLVLNIAQGNMTGAIYYNTYNAPDVMTQGNGAVMRLTLGQLQSEIYLQYVDGPAAPIYGPCISCHSVSFDGSTIVASTHSYLSLAQNFEVWAYPLLQQTQPPPGAQIANGNFGALTPSGSKILAMGNPDCTAGADSFPRAPNNFPLVEGPDEARLIDTTTGMKIASAAGLDPENYMWMPQFSPNGDMIVFNYGRPDGNGGSNRREIAIMDYDDATDTFSNLRVIASNLGPDPSLPYMPIGAGGGAIPNPSPDTGCMGSTDLNVMLGVLPTGTCSGPCYPTFPFFTPDGRGVVFGLISEPDFASAFPGRPTPSLGELWYVDLDDQGMPSTPLPLDNINKTFVASEAQHDYYPTVFPVSIAGHFWVVWTTRRSFGHHNTGDPQDSLPAEQDPFRKRLWMAALQPRNYSADEFPDLSADPSLPGFYIEGQSESGNVRGFATLNPCKPTDAQDNTCTSGLDCCTGFCIVKEGESEGHCTDEIPMCSKEGDKCDTDDDCCPPGLDEQPLQCIGGFCGFNAPPPPPPPVLQ